MIQNPGQIVWNWIFDAAVIGSVDFAAGKNIPDSQMVTMAERDFFFYGVWKCNSKHIGNDRPEPVTRVPIIKAKFPGFG